jgi:DNA-binding transcriptional LysR family regulator
MLFPMAPLIAAVRDFEREFPAVSLLLRTEALGAVPQLVLDGICSIGVGLPFESLPGDVERTHLGQVRLVAVCGKDHPLAQKRRPSAAAVRAQVQIVLTDRSPLTSGVDYGVHSERTWRVADLATKHAFIKGGIGWGSLPLHLVRDDLDSGALLEVVPPGARRDNDVDIVAVHRRASPPGPAARWLLERLRGAIAQCEGRGGITAVS